MMDITRLTLLETVKSLATKDFSEAELNQAYLKRIKRLNPTLNVFLTIQEGLKGIPVGIKDIICTQNIRTTAGSKILNNFIPPYNATIVDRLLNITPAARGEHPMCNIIGKTNCDEFAMGSSGENSAYGATKNPWDITKVSGGSSSGSAAAVAANMCVFALGTDTGGSVRQPASLCGVVGLKPSYGRVSRYGLIAMASSLDCPGVLGKSVADVRTVLGWIKGPDGFDSNVAKIKIQKSKGKNSSQNLTGVKIGIPREYFGKGLDPKVKDVIQVAIKKLKELGAAIVEIELPHTKYALSAYYIIVFSEISANLARFDGVRFGETRDKFGAEPKRRIMLGTYSLSAGYFDDYYMQAAKVRSLIKRDFEEAFEKCDVIVGPVSPTPAWNLGERVTDPLAMYLSDIYTVPASLAGIPGLSVPCGLAGGLPVGLQILGKYMNDETVLDVGEIYEKESGFIREIRDIGGIGNE